jgi:hypothetical protein
MARVDRDANGVMTFVDDDGTTSQMQDTDPGALELYQTFNSRQFGGEDAAARPEPQGAGLAAPPPAPNTALLPDALQGASGAGEDMLQAHPGQALQGRPMLTPGVQPMPPAPAQPPAVQFGAEQFQRPIQGDLNRGQARQLETYDVESAARAQTRDQKGQTYGQVDDVLLGQRDQLGAEMQREAAVRDESMRYAQQKRLELDQSQDALRRKIQQGVSPDRIFTNGTVSRTQAAMAGFLGGLYTGPNGQNSGIQLLNTMIDRDVDAQKADIQASQGQADNLLNTYVRAYGSYEAAASAFKISGIEYQQRELQVMQTRLDSVEARGNANNAIIALQREKQALQNQFESQNAAARAAALAARHKARMDAELMQGDRAAMYLNQLPPDMQKRIKDQHKLETDLEQARNTFGHVKEQLTQMQTEYEGDAPGVDPFGNLVPSFALKAGAQLGSQQAEDAALMRAAIAKLQIEEMTTSMQGVLSDTDLRLMKESAISPGDTEAMMHRKIDSAVGILNAKLKDIQTADSLASSHLNVIRNVKDPSRGNPSKEGTPYQ